MLDGSAQRAAGNVSDVFLMNDPDSTFVGVDVRNGRLKDFTRQE